MRGGLAASRPALAGQATLPVPQATATAPAIPRSPLQGVQWSLPLAGFLLYLLVITSYRLPVGDVAIVLALGGIALQRDRVRFPPYLVWLCGFSLWASIASAESRFPDWVSPQLTNMLKMCLIVFVAANALRTREHLRLFMVFFLGCFALFPLRGAMFNYFLYGNDMGGRAIWNLLYSNPNDLGAMALLQFSMALALLTSEPKGWVRLAAMAGVFLLPMLILMTQSRGVFLGLLVLGAMAFAGQRRRVRLALQLAVVAMFLVMVAPSSVWERLGTLQHATSTQTLDQVDGEGGSARQRHEIWRVAFKMIRENPHTGVGIGAYKPNHELYANDAEFNPTAHGKRDTHSLYLNVLAETGWPGLVLYTLILASVLIVADATRRRCRRVLEPAARQLLLLEAGLVGFLVASIFGSLPYLPHLLLHVVLLYALALHYRQQLAVSNTAPAAGAAPSRSTLRRA